MVKIKTNIIAALDIGSSKISCLIAAANDDGYRVIGVGYGASKGIKSGVITELKSLEDSILSAVSMAENMAEIRIEKVYVNLTSLKSKSLHIKQTEVITAKQVSSDDVSKILSDMLVKHNNDDEQIIHYFPLDYSLDGAVGIKNPQGLFGSELGCMLHIVVCPSMQIMNLANSLAKCQIDIENIVMTPYASALATLSDDELNLGSVLVDFGSNSCNIAVFKDSVLVYTDILNIGASSITNDISKVFSISLADAERIKTLYGSTFVTAFDKEQKIKINVIGENSEGDQTNAINAAILGSVIRPRAEEILDLIKIRLETSGIEKFMSKRLVITGGGAHLHGLRELANEVFKDYHIRIALPKQVDGFAEGSKSTLYSASIGLLEYGYKKASSTGGFIKNKKPNPISKIYNWVREYL